MRTTQLLFLWVVVLAGCTDSHGRPDDAGSWTDGDICRGSSSMFCVTACGSDAGLAPVCTGGEWTCPPGTRDAASCPPGCVGASPPGCVCVDTRWVCEAPRCPDGINPWDPSDPLSVCRVEGATCTGGDDPCGSGLFCRCESGRWNCAVAEPDPVCWCGREPSAGDRCSEEGSLCGQCCPTPDGPNWPAMECVGGRWTGAACPEVVCPPVTPECPVDTAAVIGRACGFELQACGNACCGTAITCIGGVWQQGPDAACLCEPSPPCGSGTCTRQQSCTSRCGPADGIELRCIALPDDCYDCGCVPLFAHQSCEMIDGHVFISDGGFCG